MLQPEPRSGEGCNTLSYEDLANVNAEKNVRSPFHSSTPDLNDNEALCCREFMGMKPAASDWSTVSRIVTR